MIFYKAIRTIIFDQCIDVFFRNIAKSFGVSYGYLYEIGEEFSFEMGEIGSVHSTTVSYRIIGRYQGLYDINYAREQEFGNIYICEMRTICNGELIKFKIIKLSETALTGHKSIKSSLDTMRGSLRRAILAQKILNEMN